MRWRALAVSVAVVSVGLTGCSGGGASTSSPSASGSSAATGKGPSTPSSQGSSVHAVVKRIMSTTDGGAPIATAKGRMEGVGKDVPMIAQVLAIRSTADATVLVWKLKSGTGGKVVTSSSRLSHPPLFDTRLLSIVDGSDGKTYYPYTYVPEGQGFGSDTGCLCSDVPYSTNTEGTVMHAVLPPLPAGTDSVSVKIPGFATMRSVKVSS